MKLTKEDISTRVLQNGIPLSVDKFSWDEKTRTFSTTESNLVLDFRDLSACTFKTGNSCTFTTGYSCTFTTGPDCTFTTGYSCTFTTGSDCTFDTGYDCAFKTGYDCAFKTGSDCTFTTGSRGTFKTGSDCTFTTGHYCTFKTGHYCTFKTGSRCTFKTGSDCTFNTTSSCTFNTASECVIVRRDIFETFLLKEKTKTIICPYGIKGYLEEIDGKFYLNGNKEDGEYIILDNILSRVIKRRGSVLKVINHEDTEESYIVEQNGYYSHGRTIEEARESIVYKMNTRDLSEFKELTLDSVLSKEESIRMYMSVTGACAKGTKSFVDRQDKQEEYSVRDIIELTRGQYGNDKLREFFSLN